MDPTVPERTGPERAPDHTSDQPSSTADRAATFDTWARLSGPTLLRFAAAVCGNPHDGADRVQDALAAVYPRWSRLSDDGAADAYARKVIVNRSVSWWRKVRRREHLTDRDLPLAADPPRVDDRVGADVVDVALARQLLAGLTTVQRAAVVLRFYLDCDFAEIAETLGCPVSTARSHVHRALARLRVSMAEGDDDD